MSANTQRSRMGLLLTTAVGAALSASAAFAQAGASNADPGANLNQLQEVVVTATRQADTVNRVPLAVTAETQKALDQQGVRTVRDLSSLVPSLTTTQTLASGASQFSIRGVGFLGNSPAGAAPVGFYLDDTPLQKRNVGGGVGTSNGTPLPPLFDLDRVEVLRGPQGTLFGGGSEGGTIRYIQPEPSLTKFSEYIRVQGSTPEKGDDSYEGGVAVGGPIVQDKLGFRASVFARKTGGFIDRVDPLSQQVWEKNSGGEGRVRMMRLAIAWAPTENSKVTVDYFSSRDESNDISTSYTLPLAGKVTVPTLCYNANNTPGGGAGYTDGNGLGFNTSARIGPISGITSAPVPGIRSQPYPVARGDAQCATLAARGDVTYTMPGFTYGPYNNSRWQSVSIANSPSKTNLEVASLTYDYDFGGKMTMKAITSYFFDGTKTNTSNTGPNQTGYKSDAYYIDPVYGFRAQTTSGPSWNPIWGPNAANVTGWFVSNNHRYGLTQEVRFASAANATPLSWVAGVYYSNIRADGKYDNYQPIDYWAQTLFGITGIQRYAVPGIETAPGLFNNFDNKRQRLKDTEVAAFAEANYWIIPDKLRATAGIRYSRVTFDYSQTFTGAVSSVGPNNLGVSPTGVAFNVPTSQNGGLNSGSETESPITPKFSLQYNLTDRDLLYVTAAKGFRAGGVNSQVSYGICQTALDQIGYLPADLPVEYKSDSVWSYEGGAKLRLLSNRVQFNAAVYRIDWTNPQYTTNPGSCGLVTTFNVPKARSQGVELEGQALVFRGFTVGGSYGYTDAKYTQGLVLPAGHQAPGGPVPTPFTVVVAGQAIPIPPHTFSVNARYEFDLTSKIRAYARGDFRLQAAFPVSPFPTVTYTPDAVNQQTKTTNFRVGIDYGDFDVNLFVNNAFDRSTGALSGGRSGCLPAASGGTAACTTFTGYNPLITLDTGYPREVGLQITYRH